MSKILVRNIFRFRFFFFKKEFLVSPFWMRIYFGGHDAMKGPRNKFEIFIVSDMVPTFRYDANIYQRQCQITFFQHGPVEMLGPCQKVIFQSKNLIRSNQTAAKV